MDFKKVSLISVVLLFISINTSAQNAEAEIRQIRKTYTDLSERIAETEKDEESGKYSDLAVNELVVNKLDRSWAAVGNFRITYRFYYQNKEEEPYPTELVKVTRNAEVAARKYAEEFVYDSSGTLIFYFERSDDGDAPLERRVYFAKGKPIRIIEDKATRDKFTNDDLSKIAEILERSSNAGEIFIHSIKD
ncbi:MAG: hypothetical protein R2681_16180 [Pyrinomonadaceae bacterium]